MSRLLGKSMSATVIELVDGRRLKELEAKKDKERRMKAIDASVKRLKALPRAVHRE